MSKMQNRWVISVSCGGLLDLLFFLLQLLGFHFVFVALLQGMAATHAEPHPSAGAGVTVHTTLLALNHSGRTP